MNWKLEVVFTSGATETMHAVTRDDARQTAKLLKTWPEVKKVTISRV